MTPEAFRKYGRAVVDWIADYYEKIESLPVLSQVEPGELRSLLPAQAPKESEAFGNLLNQPMGRLNRSGDLYLTHTRMHDQLTLRLCVGQTNSEFRHLEHAWQRIQDVAAEINNSQLPIQTGGQDG